MLVSVLCTKKNPEGGKGEANRLIPRNHETPSSHLVGIPFLGKNPWLGILKMRNSLKWKGGISVLGK